MASIRPGVSPDSGYRTGRPSLNQRVSAPASGVRPARPAIAAAGRRQRPSTVSAKHKWSRHAPSICRLFRRSPSSRKPSFSTTRRLGAGSPAGSWPRSGAARPRRSSGPRPWPARSAGYFGPRASSIQYPTCADRAEPQITLPTVSARRNARRTCPPTAGRPCRASRRMVRAIAAYGPRLVW
jgi:hypothetical protein